MGNKAVIVAGGSGVRMNMKIRKQYIAVGGVPVLGRTVSVFDRFEHVDEIILVVPEKDISYCRDDILHALDIKTKIRLIPGGDTRQQSVFNGLKELSGDDYVFIHDGVRPFVTITELNNVYSAAKKHGSAILALRATDTIKLMDKSGHISKTVERDLVWQAQTPQIFKIEDIKKAHINAMAEGFEGTDDASLFEFSGQSVYLVEGKESNIKITKACDLKMASYLIEKSD